MLKCSASLWSADLSNLAAEIHRVEPYSERFDLDVADGAAMAPSMPAEIPAARAALAGHGARVEIQLDGGIRRNTVPLIHQAGADWIVPGSLLFGEEPAAMRQWLSTL